MGWYSIFLRALLICIFTMPTAGCGDDNPAEGGIGGNADGDTDTDTDTDSDADGGADPDAGADADGSADADVDADADGGADADVDADADADGDTDPDALNISETFDPGAETPDLLPSEVNLYVPEGVGTARAILIFSTYGKYLDAYESDEWRASAKNHGYAMMRLNIDSTDGKAAFSYPEQAALFLEEILIALAEVSEHPELAAAPLFFWGHSAGGHLTTALAAYLNERTAGFIAFKGFVRAVVGGLQNFDQLVKPETLAVPGLIVLAEHDAENITDRSLQMLPEARARGAHWGLVLEPDGIHLSVGSTNEITVPFAEAVLDARLPEASGAALRAVETQSGYIGRIDHHRIYQEGESRGYEVIDSLRIESVCGDGEVNAEQAQTEWLISKAFAEQWLAYQATALEQPPSDLAVCEIEPTCVPDTLSDDTKSNLAE